ncbi:MAG: hypothetical protein J5663_09630, partial [Bacteroidaceae bacterium]|nr:hypothetical protein [Bacteroidaceae bacterium]
SGLNAAKIVDNGVGEITELMITNPSFETGDYSGWTVGDDGGDTGVKSAYGNATYEMSGSDGNYLFNTWINGGGTPIHQTLKGLAPGTYTLTALMASTRNSDNSYNWLHLNAGEEDMVSTPSQLQHTGVDMVLNFSVDEISNVEIYAWASAGEDATLFGDDHVWYKMDNVHLIYNGKKNLDEYITELHTQLGNADALLKMKMNADVELDLRNSRKTGQTVSYDDEAGLKAAIADLKAKNKAAQASVTIYSNINTIIEKGNSLDNAGKAVFAELSKDIQAKWSNGEITDGTTEIQNVQNNYITAIKQQDTPGTVMTEAVENWECNSGYKTGQFNWSHRAEAIVNGWNVLDADKNYDIVSLNDYFHVNTWSTDTEMGEDGGTPMTNPFIEFWSSEAENYLGNHHLVIKHVTESGFRPGNYTIHFITRLAQCETGAYRPKGYKFVANVVEGTSHYVVTSDNCIWISDEVNFTVNEDGNIDFQFEIDHSNFSWLAFKMVKLVYQGEFYSDKQADDIIADINNKYIGKVMNKYVETELTNALNAFKDSHSVANTNALNVALQNAKISILQYEETANQIEKYVALEAQYNNGNGFYALGHKYFTEEIQKIKNKYNERTLAIEDDCSPKKAYHDGIINQQSGDFTSLIVNPGFETGTTEGWTYDDGSDVGVKPAFNNPVYETHVENATDGEAPLYNYVFNTWSTGEVGGMIKQTIKDIPNGKYRISAYVASYNSNYVFLIGNDEHSEPFNNPNYSYDEAKRFAVKASMEVKVTDNQLTLGAIGGVGNEFPDYPSELGCWYKVDAFTLEYTGPIGNEDLYNQLMNTCDYASLLISKPMNKDSLTHLKTAYELALTTSNNTNSELLTSLNNVVKTYAKQAQNSIKTYEEIKAYLEKAKTLDYAGKTAFDELSKDIISAYNEGRITDGIEEKAILADNIRIATKAQVTDHSDWTNAIYNPGFEDKGAHWSTITDGNYKPLNIAKVSGEGSTIPWSHATGNRYAYRQNTSSSPMSIHYSQRIDSVQAGIYMAKATVYTNSKTMSLFCNNMMSAISPCPSTDDAIEVMLICVVQPNENKISIGITGTLNSGEEFRIDNIRLEFVTKEIDIAPIALSNDAKMNKDIRERQNAAILKFKMNPQPAVITEAINAISEAKISAYYYQMVKNHIDSICSSIKSNNSSLSEEEINEFCNQYNSIYVAWNEETLTTEECIEILSKSYSVPEKKYTDVSVDISGTVSEKTENATTPVVTENKDGEKHYVYEPKDATKNQTISFIVPVEVVKADNKYYVVIVLVPTEEARVRATYLSFALKGTPHKLLDRPSVPSDEVTSVLGSYLYTGEKEERLVYEFTSSQDIEAATITISTENPDASEFTNAIGLKQVSLASSEDATAIELVEKATDNVPAEIFTMSGIKVSSFQKGINIIRLSDGSVRKIKK